MQGKFFFVVFSNRHAFLVQAPLRGKGGWRDSLTKKRVEMQGVQSNALIISLWSERYSQERAKKRLSSAIVETSVWYLAIGAMAGEKTCRLKIGPKAWDHPIYERS